MNLAGAGPVGADEVDGENPEEDVEGTNRLGAVPVCVDGANPDGAYPAGAGPD